MNPTVKLALIAAGAATGLYLLTRPEKKPPPEGFAEPNDVWRPPPTKVKKPWAKIKRPLEKLVEPPTPPEGYREIFEDGLPEAVATCGARELPDNYDAALLYLKSCAMDLLFPAWSWPPREGDRQWKRNLWFDPLLHSTADAALQTPNIPWP